MGLLLLIPGVILAAAFGGPIVASKLSATGFRSQGIALRNFPHRTREIPVSAIDRFDAVDREGVWSQVRFVRVHLLLKDGSTIIVRATGDPDDSAGVTALNNKLNELRQGAQRSG